MPSQFSVPWRLSRRSVYDHKSILVVGSPPAFLHLTDSPARGPGLMKSEFSNWWYSNHLRPWGSWKQFDNEFDEGKKKRTLACRHIDVVIDFGQVNSLFCKHRKTEHTNICGVPDKLMLTVYFWHTTDGFKCVYRVHVFLSCYQYSEGT
jgi:hypothetical protein